MLLRCKFSFYGLQRRPGSALARAPSDSVLHDEAEARLAVVERLERLSRLFHRSRLGDRLDVMLDGEGEHVLELLRRTLFRAGQRRLE